MEYQRVRALWVRLPVRHHRNEVISFLLHMANYVEYKITGRNIGRFFHLCKGVVLFRRVFMLFLLWEAERLEDGIQILFRTTDQKETS